MPSTLIRFSLLVATLWLPSWSHAEDLLEVLAQARAADPLLASAQAARGIQQEVATQARAPLLPQWQLSASAQRTQDGGSRSQQLDSSLSQVLLDLGRLRTLDAERTLLSAQDARLRAAEQDLCGRVARAYFGVLSAEAALAAAQANEQALAQQVQQAGSRFAAGLAAQVDVEQARAYHALSRSGTVQAQQALADAREALAQITGHAPGALKPLAADLPALPPEPASASAWVAQALQAHPLLQAQALGLQASQQRIAAAGAGHLPTLSLGLDSERRGGPAIADGSRGRADSTLSLRVTLPLFAGGAVESQQRQAAYQRDAQRAALESDRRALVRETQAQYEAVLAGVATMQSTRAAVDAANLALASTRAGQALGTRTMTDLLLAIQTQTAAQNAFDQARHGYVLARLLLQQAVGSLGEGELGAVNRLLEDRRPAQAG
ncbi:TolC family outer membrane protein [Aquabacterium sp.]|uniref:TolC family outer membrane protein n=1 Tax=Aquabacterium sp. TaxID=1872578 RepID=UPI003782FE36